MRIFALHAIAATVIGVMAPAVSGAQDEIYYASPWNGYMVYLSPAVHYQEALNDECNGGIPDENVMAYWVAYDAGKGSIHYNDVENPQSDGRNIVARGYDVRIGKGFNPQEHINSSNAWGADLHIVIHSNADLNDPPTPDQCARETASRFGTHVIYRTGNDDSQSLAETIEAAVGPASPGTDDLICYNPGHPCTAISELGELKYVTAVPAYLESEFHTWDWGTDWLWHQVWWNWRIGVGVDQYLLYP